VLKTTTTMMMIMSETANKRGNEIVYFSGTKMNGTPYCDEAASPRAIDFTDVTVMRSTIAQLV
jgi:hypothetical protein